MDTLFIVSRPLPYGEQICEQDIFIKHLSKVSIDRDGSKSPVQIMFVANCASYEGSKNKLEEYNEYVRLITCGWAPR